MTNPRTAAHHPQKVRPGRVIEPRRAGGAAGLAPALAVAVAYFAALVATAGSALAPLLVGCCGLLSVVTFGLYGRDKAAAAAGRWRTRESTLHLLGLAGGWPGGLVAQRLFRHKTRKLPFQAVFWLATAAHGAGMGWLLVSDAATGLRAALVSTAGGLSAGWAGLWRWLA